MEIGTERLLSKSPMNSSAKAEVSSMMRTRCVNSEPVDGLVRSYKLGWYRVFYTPLQKQGVFYLFLTHCFPSKSYEGGNKNVGKIIFKG